VAGRRCPPPEVEFYLVGAKMKLRARLPGKCQHRRGQSLAEYTALLGALGLATIFVAYQPLGRAVAGFVTAVAGLF
jgi:hypothetical protein